MADQPTPSGPPSNPTWPTTPMIPSGAPGSFVGPNDPAPPVLAPKSGADISVSPDQVLTVASLFEEQANALSKQLDADLGALSITGVSADEVTKPIVEAWNQMISVHPDSYASRVKIYVENLHKFVAQLRYAAKTYRISDDQQA